MFVGKKSRASSVRFGKIRWKIQQSQRRLFMLLTNATEAEVAKARI